MGAKLARMPPPGSSGRASSVAQRLRVTMEHAPSRPSSGRAPLHGVAQRLRKRARGARKGRPARARGHRRSGRGPRLALRARRAGCRPARRPSPLRPRLAVSLPVARRPPSSGRAGREPGDGSTSGLAAALPTVSGFGPPLPPSPQAGAYRARSVSRRWARRLRVGRAGRSLDRPGSCRVSRARRLRAAPGPRAPDGERAARPRSPRPAALGRRLRAALHPGAGPPFVRARAAASWSRFASAIEPARIRATFPRYARFLEEYLAPSRFRLVVADRTARRSASLRAPTTG